jgi:hypothetical protein
MPAEADEPSDPNVPVPPAATEPFQDSGHGDSQPVEDGDDSDDETEPRRPSWWRTLCFRCLLYGFSILILVVALAGVWLKANWPAVLTAWVESEGFRNMLSRATSHSLKVQGQFEPIDLDGWTARTGGFRSIGLPGQVITRLDAQNAAGTFNPQGVRQGLWEFNEIAIERAELGLQSPTLSQGSAPRKPPPWYAVFLPTRFYPRVVDAQSVRLFWKFRGQEASIDPMHLFVTPSGRDWEFTGTGGRLAMELVPELWMKEISVHMSKPYFDVQSVTFVSPRENDPAWVTIAAKMGLLPADRKLTAKVRVHEVPIDPALPEKLRPYFEGRASGEVDWSSDGNEKGRDRASGKLNLVNAEIIDLPLLEALVGIHRRTDLTSIRFQEAGLSFLWADEVFQTSDLQISSQGLLAVRASVRLPADLSLASARLYLDRFEIDPWLPGIHGIVSGWLNWRGDPTELLHAKVNGYLSLAEGRIGNVDFIHELAKRTKVLVPQEIEIQEAWMKYSMDEGIARINEFYFRSGRDATVKGGAELSADRKHLSAKISLNNVPLDPWLESDYQTYLNGLADGSIEFDGRLDNMRAASLRGRLAVVDGVIRNNRFLQTVARFFKDEIFLELPLDEASLDYEWKGGSLKLTNINIESYRRAAVRGHLEIQPEARTIQGTIQFGLMPRNLRWLPNDGSRVFGIEDEGYRWATVNIAGTLRRPRQDLTPAVVSDLLRDPPALMWMLVRAASWWLGDVLGTYDGQPDPRRRRARAARE